MSTNFPTSLDSFTNPVSTDYMDDVPHADQHANANDAIEAIEAKLGVDSSADTASIDYKLKNPASIDPGHKHTMSAINISATDKLLGRDSAGAGAAEEISVGGGIEFTGSGAIQRSALTGDVTASAGSNTTAIANGAVTEAKQTLSDVTTNNVTSTKHGYCPKSPADATKFLNGAATPAFAQVKDSDLSVSDVTTNNVSTSAHGFVPKAPNDAAKTLDGTGAWSYPGQPVYMTSDQSFNATTSVADVTGMSWSVLNGAYYAFQLWLVCQTDTTTTGIRLTLTTPTFAIFTATFRQVISTDGASVNFYVGTINSSGDEVASTQFQATATDFLVIVEGIIVPSANGTLQLRAACEVASGIVKIRQGSIGHLRRVA